jgi:hypothetical protein
MAEINGKIKIIGELQSFSSGFTKIQVVVTSDEQYPSDIPIEFFKDKANLLDAFNVGDSVKIDVNIKGSEYQGKYYVGLIGWRIAKQDTSGHAPQNQSAVDAYQTNTNPQQAGGNQDDPDEMPF